MVGRRARRHGFVGRKVTLILRYEDFETINRRATLSQPTNDTHAIHRPVMKVMDSLELQARVRLLGVSISRPERDPDQLPLIESERKRRLLLETMDSLEDRYGEWKILWAATMQEPRRKGVISPAWRPDGIRRVELK